MFPNLEEALKAMLDQLERCQKVCGAICVAVVCDGAPRALVGSLGFLGREEVEIAAVLLHWR